MLVKYPFDSDLVNVFDNVWDVFFEHCSRPCPEHIKYGVEKAVLTLDLPGVKRSDLDVSIVGRTVTVSGRRGEREFKHEYTIDRNYDASSVDAVLEDGVLTVTFARRPETKSKKIDVKVR